MKSIKNREGSVNVRQINEVMEKGKFHKLNDLNQDNLTLEVQFPNIFPNAPDSIVGGRCRSSVKCLSQKDVLADGHGIRARDRKNVINAFREQKGTSKLLENNITFYSLVKMMFPEAPGISALSIKIMDTIFYNQDNSMTYVYTDPKRGLVKTKTRNYIDMFLKRKADLDLTNNVTKKTEQFKSQFMRDMNYVALLRYKDENFIRLKQNEFKSIFIRPVQANQKYKLFNNTLYIQLIPPEINYQQGTIFNIEFSLDRHKGTQLFNKLVDKHCEETSYMPIESKLLKQQVREMNIQAYLLCIVYEIYAYISIHHHRQLSYGVFQFMRTGDAYYLSNGRSIRVRDSQNAKNQYISSNLFQEFIQTDQNFNLEAQQQNSGVIMALSTLFSQENMKICHNVRGFIDQKISEVESRQDQLESNQIFQSINNKYQKNLHYLFENEAEYEKFLRKKQQQLDGFSPITSISNISRKRQKKQKFQLETVKNNTAIQQNINPSQKKNPFFSMTPITKTRPATSKWFKQTVNKKREYFIEKS